MNETATDPDPVRWGVMGCARIAQRRICPAIKASGSAVLHAVASRDADKARAFGQEAGASRTYGSYQELIEDPDIEVVYNPLPNSLHAKWTIAALQAGKHVLCEKAIALNAAEAVRMFDAAEAADRRLMEAFMWRFHPRSQRVKQMVRDGVLGDIKLVRASFSGNMTEESAPGNIRMNKELGGGAMLDLGCYAVTACRWFHGVEPTHAVAAGSYDPKSGIDIYISGTLVFPDGRYGQVDTIWRTWFRQAYDLLGTKGSLRVNQAFVALEGEFEIDLREGDEYKTLTLAGDDPYRLEVEHFGRAVRGIEPPAFGRRDALANAATIDAIFQSTVQQQAVEIEIPD